MVPQVKSGFAARDDKPADVEGFGCLLNRRRGLIVGQFPHQGKDDVGVGAVVVLLGLSDLHYLEAIGRRTSNVHQQTLDGRAGSLDQFRMHPVVRLDGCWDSGDDSVHLQSPHCLEGWQPSWILIKAG